MQEHHKTVWRSIYADLRYSSDVMRLGQFMTQQIVKSLYEKCKKLLLEIKHPEEPQTFFFRREKKVDQDQKMNWRKDRWVCQVGVVPW